MSVDHTSVTSTESNLSSFDAALVNPFGVLRRELAIPALIGLASLIVLFSRMIVLGQFTPNWLIQFDVNIFAGIIVIIAGLVAIGRSALSDRRTLTSQNTILIVGLVVVSTWLLLRGTFDLGIFNYTQEIIDVNTVLILVILGGLLWLASRGSQIAVGTLIFYAIWWAASQQDFSIKTFTDLFSSEDGLRLVRNLVPPKWVDFGSVLDPLFVTIKIAVVSTLLGVIIALPLSVLAARNTTPHPILYNATRSITNLIRAVPALFVALLLIPITGLGAGTGIIALAIHSFATLTKIFSESIEAVKPEPIEALRAAGANGLKQFRWGVVPQALPLLASYSLFNFESNVRDSTIVAFVGGAGIGFLLYENINLLSYHKVGLLLVVLIIAVIALDRVSDFLRSKII